MGKYINPKDETKEAFLEREGKPASISDILNGLCKSPDSLLCCLVDNGSFTAAIICYNHDELDMVTEGFASGEDARFYQFYEVSREKLQEWL